MIQGHTNSRRLNNDLHPLLNQVTESKFWLSSCITWFTFQHILDKLLSGTPLVMNPTCQWGKTNPPLKGQADTFIHMTVLFQYPLGLGLGQYPHTAYSLNQASTEGDRLTQHNLVKALSVRHESGVFTQSVNWRFQVELH